MSGYDTSYRIWLREVSIVLMDAIGKSVAFFNQETQQALEEMFNDGADVMDAAQEALNREYDGADVEELLADKRSRR